MSNKKRYETGSGNVFEDIGVPNAEEHLVKAQLVFKIDTILKKRGLKQVEAADLFGVRQPDVSKMLRGEFRQFSVERLLRFLVALDQDVEIVVKPHRSRNEAAALQVVYREACFLGYSFRKAGPPPRLYAPPLHKPQRWPPASYTSGNVSVNESWVDNLTLVAWQRRNRLSFMDAHETPGRITQVQGVRYPRPAFGRQRGGRLVGGLAVLRSKGRAFRDRRFWGVGHRPHPRPLVLRPDHT